MWNATNGHNVYIWIIETYTNTLDLSLSFFLSLFIMVVKNTHTKLSWITIVKPKKIGNLQDWNLHYLVQTNYQSALLKPKK